MGKIGFTPIQKLAFDEFSESIPLREKFYITGGTALSVFYLQHRYSDDLDFFSESKIEDKLLNEFIEKVSLLLKTNYRFTRIEDTRIFEFEKAGKIILKIDFAHYPYKRLETKKEFHKVSIDSLIDIGANKLITVSQRTEVKDFIDLYFLLQKYTFWDLTYAVEAKFRRETDLIFLGSDFLKVKDFDFLPKMIKPLTLPILKEFFTKKARQVAGRAIRK